MSNNHLYIYENLGGDQERPSIYVGIGNLGRPYDAHNPDALTLRDAHATRILVTSEPFSSRGDARKAEAIAIYVAGLLGANVLLDEEGPGPEVREIRPSTTNRSGIYSTDHLVHAAYTKDGSVDYFDLTRTAFVTLTPLSVNNSPELHGARSAAVLASRANHSWLLNRAYNRNYRPERLIAVMKSRGTILGHWELDENEPIIRTDPKNSPNNYNKFNLKDPACDNIGDIKGMAIRNFHRPRNVSWSQDISDENGLKGQRSRH